MKSVQLPPFSLVCDTSMKLDRPKARILRGAGFLGVLRYLGLGGPTAETLDAQELADLHAEDLVVGVVQYARTGGWSYATGATDGQAMAKQIESLGLTCLVTPWLDFEADHFPGGSSVAIGYASAHWGAVHWVGRDAEAGVYEGPGIPLTEEQWFHALPHTAYWRSAADVPNVPGRGWRMLQLFPPNVNLGGGVIIDADVVQKDYRGGLPWWCAA